MYDFYRKKKGWGIKGRAKPEAILSFIVKKSPVIQCQKCMGAPMDRWE